MSGMFGRLVSSAMKVPDVKVSVTRLKDLSAFATSLLPWGLPAALAAGWMLYPALTPSFKQSVGLESVPASGQKFEFEKADVGEVGALMM